MVGFCHGGNMLGNHDDDNDDNGDDDDDEDDDDHDADDDDDATWCGHQVPQVADFERQDLGLEHNGFFFTFTSF